MIRTKHLGVWYPVNRVWYKVEGVWKELPTIDYKFAGLWKRVHVPRIEYIFNDTVTVSTNNYNLRERLLDSGWNETDYVTATVTINAGVTVGSITTAGYAFSTGSLFPEGSTLKLTNNGGIYGKGGDGVNAQDAYAPARNGNNGGPALFVSIPTELINNGVIAGGGGSAGGGGCVKIQAGTTIYPLGGAPSSGGQGSPSLGGSAVKPNTRNWGDTGSGINAAGVSGPIPSRQLQFQANSGDAYAGSISGVGRRGFSEGKHNIVGTLGAGMYNWSLVAWGGRDGVSGGFGQGGTAGVLATANPSSSNGFDYETKYQAGLGSAGGKALVGTALLTLTTEGSIIGDRA